MKALTTVRLNHGKSTVLAIDTLVTVVAQLACAVCVRTQSGEYYWVSPSAVKLKL